ncbi:hypothetical protein FOK27_19580 [Salmonella enterica]|uniref:hypothetical protein n=1 Tax=Salmonella enterica TaxID=28901 RepID=UPI000FC05D9C|nr:hypothetical protein [Salmonella enterica]ECI6492895.1 hypothetical protein [Salmonella enterica subsp. enterica]ECF6264444.1 hypothetical protein [Salmonella enterica]ECH2658911.1 hypothetical protein [Salmonella enterica]MCU7083223.1 hypothetical protein [Salmonella enterica]MCU7123220.1 hypothetical protein [Salmonella enterica]
MKFNQRVALKEVFSLLSPDLDTFEFIPNKKLDKYIKRNDKFIFSILINIDAWGRQHLILQVENKEISHVFQNVMKEMKLINDEIVLIKGARAIASVTDWKFLFEEYSVKYNNVWFSTLSCVDDILNLKDDYVSAFFLANQWFDRCKQLEYLYEYNLRRCITYSAEIALCIGKLIGKNTGYDLERLLNEKYGKIHPSGFKTREVKLFHSILSAQNVVKL